MAMQPVFAVVICKWAGLWKFAFWQVLFLVITKDLVMGKILAC